MRVPAHTAAIVHVPLQWRHNGRDGVSNHQPHDCLLNRLFRRRSKTTSKLRVTGLRGGNSPVTVEFPAQRASNAENVSIWWCHHVGGWGTSLETAYWLVPLALPVHSLECETTVGLPAFIYFMAMHIALLMFYSFWVWTKKNGYFMADATTLMLSWWIKACWGNISISIRLPQDMPKKLADISYRAFSTYVCLLLFCHHLEIAPKSVPKCPTDWQ